MSTEEQRLAQQHQLAQQQAQQQQQTAGPTMSLQEEFAQMRHQMEQMKVDNARQLSQLTQQHQQQEKLAATNAELRARKPAVLPVIPIPVNPVRQLKDFEFPKLVTTADFSEWMPRVTTMLETYEASLGAKAPLTMAMFGLLPTNLANEAQRFEPRLQTPEALMEFLARRLNILAQPIAARAALHHVVRTGMSSGRSVQDYAAAYLTAMGATRDMDEDTKVFMFLQGLSKEVCEAVLKSVPRPRTFQEHLTACESSAAIDMYASMAAPPKRSAAMAYTAKNYEAAVPMDCNFVGTMDTRWEASSSGSAPPSWEADMAATRRVMAAMYNNDGRQADSMSDEQHVNAISRAPSSRGPRAPSSASSRAASYLPRPPFSPERAREYEAGLCFNCKKPGHLSRNCREPRVRNTTTTTAPRN